MKKIKGKKNKIDIISLAVDKPRKIFKYINLFALFVLLLVTLPTVFPKYFGFLNSIKVDTDPENMLSKTEAVRIFNDQMKKEFSQSDMIVVGITNDQHSEGVFNVSSLGKIYELTNFAKTLSWEDENDQGNYYGVIAEDIIAPSTVDYMEQGGYGVVNFDWLLPAPPKTEAEALAVRDKAMNISFFKNILVSDSGKAVAIYLPITDKKYSYKVSSELQKKIAEFSGPEKFYITGLPVANDTFGVQMFRQMAISAPLAMLLIFFMLLYFFRRLVLIVPPMFVALVSVIATMGFLIITGNTIHIMSSMIPIFIMPISVLNSIHLLSEFYHYYQQTKNKQKAIKLSMKELFLPMFYTSLTSVAGFLSLALTPIPPVQVFGFYVGLGIIFAWFFTITIIPAAIMLTPDKYLSALEQRVVGKNKNSFADKVRKLGQLTYKRYYLILVLFLLLVLISVYGITKININDNPVKWFSKDHPIRVADTELNKHFAGTYMAYLTLNVEETPQLKESVVDQIKKDTESIKKQQIRYQINYQLDKLDLKQPLNKLLADLEEWAWTQADRADDADYSWWEKFVSFLDNAKKNVQVFKDPAVLAYVEQLQNYLQNDLPVVGKVVSVVDIVKTVHRELYLGKQDKFVIPQDNASVAQCLLTFQNSHRPQDLWHFITPDYQRTSLWVQLKAGDNQYMSEVVKKLEKYIAENPGPVKLEHRWFGLTYINVIWQEKMVSGMMKAFLGSFLVVFLMMAYLFHSVLWGILSMVPLTVTISLIYGLIGLAGKDYDMPIAVLSSLTLGLAVDFAIHFIARSRSYMKKHGKSWHQTINYIFGEPAQAIVKNIIVISIGFLPLLAAPLIPYKTVGFFFAAILAIAGVSTLILLPAAIALLEKVLFTKEHNRKIRKKAVDLFIVGIAVFLLLYLNIDSYLKINAIALIIVSPLFALGYVYLTGFLVRRKLRKYNRSGLGHKNKYLGGK